MLETLNNIDQSLLLTLNGFHSPFFDQFFYYATKPIVWLPLYLLIIYLVIRTFKWKTITIVIGLALMITASDQLANLSKHGAKRFRPSNEPEIEQLVHTVNGYKGGQYGFFSAHASTNFALAVFLILLLRRRYRWIIPVMLVYASVMAYSRIYLGVHYPGDILAGTFIGIVIGTFFAWLTEYVIRYQVRCALK